MSLVQGGEPARSALSTRVAGLCRWTDVKFLHRGVVRADEFAVVPRSIGGGASK